MKRRHTILALAALLALGSACTRTESMDAIGNRVFALALQQFPLLDRQLEYGRMPRSLDADGNLVTSDIGWWCSGFFPGSLWYVYEYTGFSSARSLAEKQTLRLEELPEARTQHDIGFMVNNSYGNAYRLTGDMKYLDMIEFGARKLAGRYSPATGCTMSWEPQRGWSYPVIIDNMMNLELLMNAYHMFGADSLHTIAVTHATTTMKNHFREDASTWHLLDYSPEDGSVLQRVTVQGYSDDSAWARGQAWGLYGYTMMSRECAESEELCQKRQCVENDVTCTDCLEEEGHSAIFLAQAEKIARMLLQRLPEDGIPYWDFDAPGVPGGLNADATDGNGRRIAPEDVLRDASAAAIMASAFIELSTLTDDHALANACRSMAEKQIRTLASPDYLAAPGENGGFLLKHCVGHLPNNSEVDVPLTYADYYFLEALVRLKKYKNIL